MREIIIFILTDCLEGVWEIVGYLWRTQLCMAKKKNIWSQFKQGKNCLSCVSIKLSSIFAQAFSTRLLDLACGVPECVGDVTFRTKSSGVGVREMTSNF